MTTQILDIARWDDTDTESGCVVPPNSPYRNTLLPEGWQARRAGEFVGLFLTRAAAVQALLDSRARSASK